MCDGFVECYVNSKGNGVVRIESNSFFWCPVENGEGT